MPITDEVRESNSPWIKANKRLPPVKQRFYSARNGATKCILFFDADESLRSEDGVAVTLAIYEWLDEEKLSRMVAELEAKDKRIAELETKLAEQFLRK